MLQQEYRGMHSKIQLRETLVGALAKLLTQSFRHSKVMLEVMPEVVEQEDES